MMNAVDDLDDMLADCIFAIGQAVGRDKKVEQAAIVWWHARYREFFSCALDRGNSWTDDRRRVTAVARYLGQQAARHALSRQSIDCAAAADASLAVEQGCHMQALPQPQPAPVRQSCTKSASMSFPYVTA